MRQRVGSQRDRSAGGARLIVSASWARLRVQSRWVLEREATMTATEIKRGGGSIQEFPDFGLSKMGDDRLREECGVFGVFWAPRCGGHHRARPARAPHRGQEAAGIVSQRRLVSSTPNAAWAWSATLQRRQRHAPPQGHHGGGPQPLLDDGRTRPQERPAPLCRHRHRAAFALPTTANLTNALTLRQELISSGAIFPPRPTPKSSSISCRARSAGASSSASSKPCARSTAPGRSSPSPTT